MDSWAADQWGSTKTDKGGLGEGGGGQTPLMNILKGLTNSIILQLGIINAGFDIIIKGVCISFMR